MKKLLMAVSLFALSLGVSAPVLAATPAENVLIQARIDAMLPGGPVVASHYQTNVDMVMKLNGISFDAAIARIARALIAQNGYMPEPPFPVGYFTSYNPAFHAFQQSGQGFYAGVDPVSGSHVFTTEQRASLLDSFWYCSKGQVYTYLGLTSVCK